MRVLVYSDVHGNLPAFESMLSHAGPCDQYVCLGDLVNYGPWGDECVDLALSLPRTTVLMGNHEEAFLQGAYPGKNELVKQFFSVTHPRFRSMDKIAGFQKDCRLGEFLCRHTILDRYIYPDTSIALDGNYIIGHSHHQFKYTNNGFTLYNTGSVGQDRKRINVCNYLLYDTESRAVSLRKALYPLDKLIRAMESLHYPAECLAYYLNKETAKSPLQ